jgi:phospholipase/carboxylesterase
MALHGGMGHGADFLWSWLREARTRGFILVTPTSAQDTWSLMGEELDLSRLLAIVDYLREGWSIDEQHILLTGMSDGATYSLMAGSQPDSPFTHLAPFSGVLHPELVMHGRLQNLKATPIYLVHGTEDWMFPVEAAQMAQAELNQVGCDLTYREITGLSHHFARTELPAVLQWFNSVLSAPGTGDT